MWDHCKFNYQAAFFYFRTDGKEIHTPPWTFGEIHAYLSSYPPARLKLFPFQVLEVPWEGSEETHGKFERVSKKTCAVFLCF